MRANLRSEFGGLARLHAGRPLVYLDAAASTPSPASVLAREWKHREEVFANVHRGRHLLSEEASNAYEEARVRVARFVNAAKDAVVFTSGATEALNVVARGLGLRPQDLVLTTFAEHHANLVPWMREARVAFLEGPLLRPLEPVEVAGELERRRPQVLALHHVSNVTGVVQPIGEICRVARELGVITVVDASQSLPHVPVDLEALGADFLAFSGHKVLGPKGIGVLCGRADMIARLAPLRTGGGAVQTVGSSGYSLRRAPEGLEAGTPHVTGAVGLAAALDYLESLGRDAIAAHGRALSHALRGALGALPIAQLLASEAEPLVPIVSFTLRRGGIPPEQLAIALSDSFGVMVRSGLFCAHPFFTKLGVPEGAVRASAYVYNDLQEIAYLADCISQLLERFGG